MTRRRPIQALILAGVVAGIVAIFWGRRAGERPPPAPRPEGRPAAPEPPAAVRGEKGGEAAPAIPAPDGESRLADDLNAPGGTIQRDLEILNELFATWQTNFPRTGNPVGENAEITAALAGDNPVRFAFIPRRHRAINARGEMCDRWGTPFRFHQLSGQQMEIRSAGPDRRFGTADDAAWTPPP